MRSPGGDAGSAGPRPHAAAGWLPPPPMGARNMLGHHMHAPRGSNGWVQPQHGKGTARRSPQARPRRRQDSLLPMVLLLLQRRAPGIGFQRYNSVGKRLARGLGLGFVRDLQHSMADPGKPTKHGKAKGPAYCYYNEEAGQDQELIAPPAAPHPPPAAAASKCRPPPSPSHFLRPWQCITTARAFRTRSCCCWPRSGVQPGRPQASSPDRQPHTYAPPRCPRPPRAAR